MVEDILTLEEAGALAKVKPATVRTWLQLGKLPGLKSGKLWRVRRADIERFLEESVKVPLRLVAPEEPAPEVR